MGRRPLRDRGVQWLEFAREAPALMLTPTATRLVCVVLMLLAVLALPRRTGAQEYQEATETAIREVSVSLYEGQQSALYALRGGVRLTAERRGAAWEGPATNTPSPRNLTESREEVEEPRTEGRALASMTLVFTPSANGTLLSVRLPGPSGPLAMPGDERASEVAALDVPAAGWITVEGDDSPEAFVHVLEPGAYCCAYTLLARRSAQGDWTWRSHSWGAYRNLPWLDDLDGDGNLEWIARDEDFRGDLFPHVAGAFGPLAIWRATPTRFAAVTWRFPSMVAEDARWLGTIEESDLALASWVAETRLLGGGAPMRALRASAVRRGVGESHNLTPDAWLRRIAPRVRRYVATHGAPEAPRRAAPRRSDAYSRKPFKKKLATVK